MLLPKPVRNLCAGANRYGSLHAKLWNASNGETLPSFIRQPRRRCRTVCQAV
ncbi:hypothetical protein HMPREF9120_01838 [Neisseria sp. oral taxon 020 str. F0370]|nr:hypothetical protein HMPREF9120_01838 [Neisseria sp. oral taxon 020 str. F0370]